MDKGEQVHCKCSGPEEGLPLLCLHELGGSSESWQWLDPLLGARFRRILVDLPGAGKSGLPEPNATLDHFAATMISVLDRLGLERVNVTGIAFGSLVATFLAANYPQRIESVMLVAVAPSISPAVAERLIQRAEKVAQDGMAPVIDMTLQASLPKGFAEAQPAVFAAYQKIFLQSNPLGYARSSLATASAGSLLSNRLGGIQCRTAVIGGELDPLFPPAAVQAAADLLPNRVKPHILPGVGHLAHVQVPVDLANLMQRFFK